jgi:hypothetical protein
MVPCRVDQNIALLSSQGNRRAWMRNEQGYLLPYVEGSGDFDEPWLWCVFFTQLSGRSHRRSRHSPAAMKGSNEMLATAEINSSDAMRVRGESASCPFRANRHAAKGNYSLPDANDVERFLERRAARATDG